MPRLSTILTKPDSYASRYQSRHYGPNTPRGGFFARLTSLGMLGKLVLVVVLAGVVAATMGSGAFWASFLGREVEA